jgi:hypothetical protein
MRLAIGWLHEAGDPPQPTPRGGSMTLAIGWLHDGGETAGTWLHEAGDWHRRTSILISDAAFFTFSSPVSRLS